MTMLFINLPVHDLAAARDFYTALGFGLHEHFSDERTAAFTVADDIALVLHDRDRFAEQIADEVADPATGTSAVLCLTADSRAEVDRLVATALEAGGRPWLPVRSDDVRYVGSFTDPDGHVWESMVMEQRHVVN